jgi:uncharacterized protein
MRQRFSVSAFIILLFASFISLSAQSLSTSPLPEPTGMVNDYANIIEDGVQAQIEQKLRDFKTSTNPQVEISVVIVKTTGDRPIFDYSLAVARGWKIGSKNDDNPSALLIIAVDDRKYFTQVSKDLEDELPDGIVGSLNRQYLVPAFKQANYTKGVSDTIDAYIAKINERASEPSANQTESPEENSGLGFGCMIVICLLVLFVMLMLIFSRGGGNGGGGGTGSGGGDQDRWRSGGFGGNTSNNSSPIIFWGGGGGSSDSGWGSSSGGGGDSWGGFGGGGDFGGGGSGGDW